MTDDIVIITPEQELLNSANTGHVQDEPKTEEKTPEQKLIEELTGKLTHAEERASEAERQRDSERAQKDDARNKAKTAAESNLTATETSLRNARQAAKSEFLAIQKEYSDAYDSGDKERLIQAQIKLNDAQDNLRNIERQNTQFDEWKEKNKEAIVSQTESRFTPREQAWIDKNPRFNTDRKFRAGVYAAHEEAIQKGIEIDSSEYFQNIEDYLADVGLKETDSKPVTKQVEEPVVKDARRQSSSTALPPSGSTTSSQSVPKNSFRMTSEHREAAAICFPDEYKKNPRKAEEMYAAQQIEIQQKRARGEKI